MLLLAAPGRAAESPWLRLDAVAEEAVAAGNVPGVVLLVGQRGKTVYRKAFGSREIRPEKVPMTVDTVFDLASLTKVVATTSAVMALVEEGKLRLRDPAARYWPEFGQNGKERVTIRHLLTHTSGLPAWENYERLLRDPAGPGIQDHREKVLQGIAQMPLRQPPDARFVYSDLGFITLGELVRRVSGRPLDEYVETRIFRPLGMRETGFNPGEKPRARAAPTTMRGGRLIRGEVHDPNAAVMGGVAGHAGLFSTADDLARFARMLLSSDTGESRNYPLSPATVREMTTPHTPAGLPVRGLGWDIDSGYSHVRGDLLPVGSFGHTGFTGTYMWIDPHTQTFIIGLSNRVHPDGGGNPLGMWAKAANVVAGIVRPQELAPRPAVAARAPVLTGIDVLVRDGFKPLQGRRVGLITNRTGVNRERVSTIDLLHKAPGVQLLALFSPEHGLRAELDEYVPSSRDEKTGLPIHSLYGRGKYKPLPEQLQGLDTLVYDIQDVGVRYYTYITTLGLAMEAAGENGLQFFVLDRPNPITGTRIDGPLLEPERRSFAGYYRLPIRHGMTVGELARFYRDELGVRCELTVVAMEGWRRSMWFEETGLPWVDPSPNIRNTRQAELYAGIGLMEFANVSVGRGTDTPFERFGAPWIDGARLAAELNRRSLPGLRFVPVTFKPVSREFQGEQCGGVDVRCLDREVFDGVRTAIEILDALVRLFPDQAKIERTQVLFGTGRIPQAILAGRPVPEIVESYQQDVRDFRQRREKHLIYR
jgi:uncharacterized protein YbbC (DUF1343 family)